MYYFKFQSIFKDRLVTLKGAVILNALNWLEMDVAEIHRNW